MDIAAWLRNLGLERYEATFRENEIDWEVLPELTADDLKDIGVTAVGHRRKVLASIAALRAPGAPLDPIPLSAPTDGGPPGGHPGATAEAAGTRIAPEAEHKFKLEVARQRIQTYSDCLLIFDNLETLDSVRAYLPKAGVEPHILITSRSPLKAISTIRRPALDATNPTSAPWM